MIDPRIEKQVNYMLILLIVMDLVLSAAALFFPGLWWKIFSDRPHVEPQGLQRGFGALWAGLLLLQVLAYLRWKRELWWLPLIAGVHFTEMFVNWVLLAVGEQLTWIAWISYGLTPPATVFFSFFLLNRYQKIVAAQESSGQLKAAVDR